LLQARLFSYPDTQRYRLGGNYLMLPVNAPRNSHFNNMHGGEMNFMHRSSEVNYWPSTNTRVSAATPEFRRPGVLQGKAERRTISREMNFEQAGERYRSFDIERRDRFRDRLLGTLRDPRLTPSITNKIVEFWTNVDSDLGSFLRAGL
jgi:catalase